MAKMEAGLKKETAQYCRTGGEGRFPFLTLRNFVAAVDPLVRLARVSDELAAPAWSLFHLFVCLAPTLSSADSSFTKRRMSPRWSGFRSFPTSC